MQFCRGERQTLIVTYLKWKTSFLASIRSDGEFNDSYKNAVEKVGPPVTKISRYPKLCLP